MTENIVDWGVKHQHNQTSLICLFTKVAYIASHQQSFSYIGTGLPGAQGLNTVMLCLMWRMPMGKTEGPLKYTFNSLPASDNYCRLLITFANSLYPDHDQ